jgi:putative transcriptional regulator
MPHLNDPNFARSVVLMIDHNDEGSFGLIVNQESDLPVAELLGSLDIEWTGPADQKVWSGGPVMPSSGWVLHEVPDDSQLNDDLQGGLELGEPVRAGPNLALSTSKERLAVLALEPPTRSRFLLGYSGWGPGQLADEMKRGSWLHADVTLELVFDTPADELWDQALRSIGVNPETIVQSRGIH